eukprot:3824668-Amphidinium_carterae.1
MDRQHSSLCTGYIQCMKDPFENPRITSQANPTLCVVLSFNRGMRWELDTHPKSLADASPPKKNKSFYRGSYGFTVVLADQATRI